MTGAPATLERAGIAARIPHAGPMCLLERLLCWSDDDIVCEAVNHADERHPMRLAGTLSAACALEYAGQAMALHGALCAAAGHAQRPGFLASARALRLHVPRLDDVAGPLRVRAQRLAGDAAQAMYGFTMHDERGRLLVEGRATVVFDAPLRAQPVDSGS